MQFVALLNFDLFEVRTLRKCMHKEKVYAVSTFAWEILMFAFFASGENCSTPKTFALPFKEKSLLPHSQMRAKGLKRTIKEPRF